ncbi:hypothetical protein BA190_31715 [Labrys sp. WJW]|nr:hypothetical protein BA190_31715 [Labrys sp. WJW]
MPPSLQVERTTNMTKHIKRYRLSLLDFFAAPFRPRASRQLDPRDLGDHLKRDLGLIDGNRAVGGVRWR